MTEAEIHHAVMVVRNASSEGADIPPPEVFELVAQVLCDLHVIAEAHRAMTNPPGHTIMSPAA